MAVSSAVQVHPSCPRGRRGQRREAGRGAGQANRQRHHAGGIHQRDIVSQKPLFPHILRAMR